MSRILDDAELRRIHLAEHNGLPLHELAKMYRVHQTKLRRQLDAWRQARNLLGVVKVTQAQLCEAADRVIESDLSSRDTNRNWLFAK
jgi:hypothetical protein